MAKKKKEELKKEEPKKEQPKTEEGYSTKKGNAPWN